MDLIKEVAIKLGVVNEKGSILYRRVDLSCHLDSNGNNTGSRCYKTLKLLAIQSFTGSHDVPAEMDLPRFRVTLHYTDRDGDEIMIGSARELKEALEMFRDEKVIKILADVAVVDPPASSPFQPVKDVSEASHSRASTATQTTSHSSVPATNPPVPPPIPPHVIHSIFHSVNAVADTLKHAETGTAADAPSTPPGTARTQKDAAVVHNIFGTLIPTLMQVDKAVQVAADRSGAAAEAAASKEPATETQSETKEAPKDPPTEAKPTSKSPPPEAPKPEETDKAEQSPPSDEAHLFIHGRHTCDGCLTTPIVGKRFHAVNLPDYDLCENCVKNYTGDQVKFEEAELDRDREFQERWHRRRAKWAGRNHASGCRHHGVPRCARGSWAHRHPGCFGPPAPHAGPSPDQVDSALKEAIRRSLIDFKKAKATEEAKTTSETVQPKMEEIFTSTAETEESSDLSVEAATESEKELANKPEAVKSESPEPKVEVETTLTPTEEEVLVPEPPVKSSDEEKEASVVVDETHAVSSGSDEPEIVIPSAASTASSEGDDPEIVFDPKDKVENTPSHADEVGSRLATPPAVKERSTTQPVTMPERVLTPAKKPAISAPATLPESTTYGVDAENYGDIAVVLGQALDKVAKGIDELNVELDRPSRPRDEDESEKVHTTIIEANHPKDDEDNSDNLSEGSWNVVPDEQLGDTEALARAAHVIGSALFNSDMARSHEDVSAMTRSEASNPSAPSCADSCSSVTSVPSTVRTIATAWQHERWATQLEQLHELGFLNDNLLIETIERLNAANIGVDSTDEVTVQQVIEELMKDW